MSMLDNLKAYYIDEGSFVMFACHKLWHVSLGALGASLMLRTGTFHAVLVALGVAFVLGIIKEIFDQVQTAGQYHEPYTSSFMDVLITTSGGVVALFLVSFGMYTIVGLGAMLFITMFIAAELGGGKA